MIDTNNKLDRSSAEKGLNLAAVIGLMNQVRRSNSNMSMGGQKLKSKKIIGNPKL
ncbi:hypothetical protein [Vibrio hyugaensis]|uniref:hypothetical protein n=1 Tax=Vibrio hyugaensis TaxID=1534743 RepID=UPI000ABD927D|nr:hypothetical protein [Vibrio hyugaensis]